MSIQDLVESVSEIDVLVVTESLDSASSAISEGDFFGALFHFGEAHGVLCLLESSARGHDDEIAEARLSTLRVRIADSVDNLRNILSSPS